jgi:hypothetical protein
MGTFKGCTSLSSITIPENIINIGNYAFANCVGLKEITSKAVNPPVISQGTFNNVDKTIPLYVPTNSVETYQSATYWSEFSNISQDMTGIVAIENNNDVEITIHNGRLSINSTNNKAVVRIYSLHGVLLHDTTGCHTVDITLQQGIYLVQVDNTIRKVVL